MDNGFEALYGSFLATKGVSMTVCGFAQTFSLFKLSFANELSLNSTVRKNLSRLAYLWIIAELLKLLSPIPATALIAQEVKTDFGQTDCIELTQLDVPSDRKWPDVDVEAGVAELIFGNSIGILRSQISDPLEATTAIMAPQLVGAVDDGDTIVGAGFVTDIVTDCKCPTTTLKVTDLEEAGLPVEISADMKARADSLSDRYQATSMVNHVKRTAEGVSLFTILANTPLCGGRSMKSYPVCKTTFSNHRHCTVEMRYMTDGTPASIAQENVKIREIGEPANIDWVYSAMVSILGNQTADYELASTVPGVVNPLMYWTTSDLLSINPSLFEYGLETTFTILLRAGMQRTFNHQGNKCTRNVVLPQDSSLTIQKYGLQTVQAMLSLQLIFTAIAIIAFLPWLLAESPIGPAVRAVHESIYFTALLADSNFSENIRNLCNAPTFAIWQGLDTIVRVGEAVETVDEDVGRYVINSS